jgi:hypothetical protein
MASAGAPPPAGGAAEPSTAAPLALTQQLERTFGIGPRFWDRYKDVPAQDVPQSGAHVRLEDLARCVWASSCSRVQTMEPHRKGSQIYDMRYSCCNSARCSSLFSKREVRALFLRGAYLASSHVLDLSATSPGIHPQ